METLRNIFIVGLISFLGIAATTVEAKKTSPFKSTLGKLAELRIEAESAHRKIIELNLALDVHKTAGTIATAYKYFTTMVNALTTHCTFFVQSQKNYTSNKLWAAYEHEVIDFYINTKGNLANNAQSITTAVAHVLRLASTSEIHKKELNNIQMGIALLIIWTNTNLGDQAATRKTIIDHVEALVKLNQELHKAIVLKQATPSLKWRLAKFAIKIAALSLAVYGLDCATGGLLREVSSNLMSMLSSATFGHTTQALTPIMEKVAQATTKNIGPAIETAAEIATENIVPVIKTVVQAAHATNQTIANSLLQQTDIIATPVLQEVAKQTCYPSWNFIGRMGDFLMGRC